MKKKWMVLAAAAVVAGSLAACSGGSGETNANADAQAAGNQSDTQAPSDGSFPNQTIEMIVPFGAGGGADIATRLICSYAEKELGQSIVINNVTGGGGTIGLTQMTKANPDGYTLAYFASTNSNDDLLFEGVSYNKDSFAPICQFTADPHIIVASKKSGITDVQGLIDAGSDGKTLWGIGGAWTHWDFLKMEFEEATGTNYKRLVYEGGAAAINDVASGDCTVATPFVSEALAQIDAGNVVPIAITSSERNELAPDVPTLAESGIEALDGFSSTMWRGFVAPAGTPDEALQKISDAFEKACADPEFQEKAKEAGLTIEFMGLNDFKVFYDENHDSVKAYIEGANLEG